MSYHKLLLKQLERYLPDEFRSIKAIENFLAVINDSYKAFDKDREFADRVFRISEEEYVAVNKKLETEIEVKRLSVEKLKEAMVTISGETTLGESDDLLLIARYLNLQVGKRKDAEKFFTSLISNLQSGILLEDENRHIVFTNQMFCDLFNIPVAPDTLQGVDCSRSAEQFMNIFRHPEAFIKGIDKLLAKRKLVTGELLELATGKIYQRDYIPVFSENKYRGQLWSYTDITEKKKIQDKIEESELRNRLVMNSALDAIIIINWQGRISFWNLQAEKIFGWQAEEVIGKKLTDIIIPASYRSAHKKGLDNYNRTGHGPALNKILELSALNKEGREFPIELSIIPIKQGDNEFFCSFIRDISERKRSKEVLERLSRVASANENGVLFTKTDGSITWANDGFYRLTGFEEDEVIGKTPIELCKGPLTDKGTLEKVVESFFKEEVFNTEIIYYRKDKSWFWGRSISQPLRNAKGDIIEYFGIIEDVTSAKNVQQKLKQYEEQLKIALTNVGDNYWEHNFETGKTFFSTPDNTMLGFVIDEEMEIAKLWWERVHPDDKNQIIENDEKYKRGEIEQHTLEYRIVHSDDTEHWVLDRGVVIEKDITGKPLKIIGTHIDITSQKNLEIELIREKEKAEASTRSKEIFLANMSHEIRTPMNAIVGMGNQLAKTELSGQQKFYHQTINTAADNLLVIINDILDLSKIEAGKLNVEKIGFEPGKVIANAMQVLMHKAEEKGLKLTNSFCDKRISPVLIGDPYRLNQVLLNLISNAVKFTERGFVDVTCEVIHESDDSQIIQGKVIDSGIGMEKEFVQKLFDKFSQEYESVSRKYGGTGLGMSICKQLIGLMGGTIEVISEKGKGTTMTFRIGFKKGTIANLPVQVKEKITGNFLKGKIILVADDNEMNRLVASTILANYGARIIEASNGEEALVVMGKNHIDLILMDIQMPVLNGYDATRIIRESNKTIPIIALTANAVKGESENCISAGMNDYITKPFKEEVFLNIIAHWLKQENGIKAKPNDDENVEVPLYDLSTLHTISKGDTSFVNKMVDIFCSQTPLMIQQMKEAYRKNNLEETGAIAHKIKPSIDNLKINSIQQVIRSIENAGKKQTMAGDILTQIQLIEDVINKTIKKLRQEFPE